LQSKPLQPKKEVFLCTLGVFKKVYECQDYFPVTASHSLKPAETTDNTTKLLSLVKQKEESLPAKNDFADRLFWFGHWPEFKPVKLWLRYRLKDCAIGAKLICAA